MKTMSMEEIAYEAGVKASNLLPEYASAEDYAEIILDAINKAIDQMAADLIDGSRTL